MELSLGPIVEQLVKAGLKRVDGVLEFAAQTSAPAQLPAHFVVPTGEQAGDNRTAGGRDQRVLATFSVMAVLAATARQSSGPSEALREATTTIKNALTGWTHPGASGPTDYVGGRMVSADGSTVVWAVQFRCPYHLRKAS